MNILQIIAHPEEQSFTRMLAKSFVNGAENNGHTVKCLDIYNGWSQKDLFRLVSEADHLCFAWPSWWEMPPAPLVNLLQTIFVKGFAFDLIDGRMQPLLNIPTTCLISMGQKKDYNTSNLNDAMQYCGLRPHFYIFDGVGLNLSKEKADQYLDMAFYRGTSLKERTC